MHTLVLLVTTAIGSGMGEGQSRGIGGQGGDYFKNRGDIVPPPPPILQPSDIAKTYQPLVVYAVHYVPHTEG